MATAKTTETKKKPILVIVESPTKAGSIKGYLGANYQLEASEGHIRDLPKSTLGVDIENGFAPHYINIRNKGDLIKRLKKQAKAASRVLIATDSDREGEAIAWHIAEVLGIDKSSACRVTFNEVTKATIKAAVKSPRAIDENLVDAQQARRILDRIMGYKLSPLLWRSVRSGLSAGRVQSVATRIITDREEEIRNFVPQEYWTISALLVQQSGETLEAKFFGDESGKIRLESEAQALAVKSAVESGTFVAKTVRRTQKLRQPAAPFTTSTLQQEAYHKLNFRSQDTMKVAQELYEGINLGSEFGGTQGLITYMRTDSLRVSETATTAARELIGAMYGAEFVPTTPNVYKSKKAIQDAHEAIRPANVAFVPSKIRSHLTPKQYRLYKLIWERFIASQMAPAVYDSLSIDFENGGYLFKASGNLLKFRGYTAVYYEEQEDKDEEAVLSHLPSVAEGETFQTGSVNAAQHFTEAPLRYTEGSLVKFLEENGIGRPSTYTTIITTILKRNYVKRDGKSLVPTPLGEITNKLMKENFPDIVDYEFTAGMESSLDEIEQGSARLDDVLTSFYAPFERALVTAQDKLGKETVEVPDDVSDYTCEICGKPMVYKNGRYGRFLACSAYPECKNTKAIDKNGAPIEKKEKTEELAGFKCELCGADAVLRNGKHGQFYACSRYPACRFTKPKTNPIKALCPDCGAQILVRRTHGKSLFYSCERYPECKFSVWDMPTEQTCPDCGQMLLQRKSKKLLICRNKDCGYKIEYTQDEDGRNDADN
ncbi:MAG: type I DNA topoisomerase [Clostridia bacterium]|nr:type I DNA topoisomerase [Clostridia bacterium]